MKKTFLSILLLVSMHLGAQEKPFTIPTIKSWEATTGTWGVAENLPYLNITSDEAKLAPEELIKQLSNGYLGVSGVKKPQEYGVHYKLSKNKQLGQEGYTLNITPKGITVEARTPQGALWATQTLLQMMEQSNHLPCGTITDVPDYSLRGFMIDCGRKNIPLDYLYNLVNLMSYYKMNTLQVHLNDNGFKKFYHDKWEETYAGFRIESELFPGLASKDGHYTKEAFRNFVKYAAKMGVDIIPEIDAPAHALAFTHYRPSLSSQEFGMDHLNLRNPAVIPFLDSLYSEYLGGPDPVFAGPRVHIGTDEYSNKDQAVVELFRGLTDHLIKTVESYGKQACVWGSLTHAKGETPVKAKNVIMDLWSSGYANPVEMKKLGYQLVSIPDGYVYIVPEAGYYYNYLNCQYLYEHWTPAQVGGHKFEERDPQMLGGMFAVWNDIPNSISVGDIHHRLFPAMQVIAEKTWHAVNDTVGYAQWDKNRQQLGEGMICNELGTNQVQLPRLEPNKSIPIGNNKWKVKQIGYDYQVDFDITWADEKKGTALMTSPRSRFFLADPIGGWIGFERDGDLFTFQYKGVKGVAEHITIVGTNRSTTLFVNGKKVQELGYDERFAADKSTYNIVRTLVFPLDTTGDFKSYITNFKAQKKVTK